MAAIVTGIGTALPEVSRPTNFYVAHAQKMLCQTPRQAAVLEELYRRTEISSRSSVLISPAYGTAMELIYSPGMEGGPGTAERMRCYAGEVLQLAKMASQRALADAGIECDTVTHLVTVSCTGFSAPGFDVQLIQGLPLRLEVERTHIGFMGCHGAMNALRIARGLVEADCNNVVLVCAAELCSLHFQYEWTADNVIANALFADGAAAVLVKSQNNLEIRNSPVDAGNVLRLVATGSLIVPDTSDAMTWEIGDHGFQMRLAATVPQIIKDSLLAWMDKWLGRLDYSRREITNWIVHPGGPRILDAVEDCLDLEENALSVSRAILSEYGNMSSPTVLFVLERMRRDVAGPCVMLGFGPGLTIEAALLVADSMAR